MGKLKNWAALGLILSLLCAVSGRAQVNVLTYHNNNARTGGNLKETLLAPSNVKTNTFGKLFAYDVDGQVYAQPLYVSGLTIPGRGTRNVVFVATQHNSVYAFDADSNGGNSGGLLWHTNLGPPAVTPTFDFGTRYGEFTDIVPEVGITGTPVIDLGSGTLYVNAVTHEGPAYYHKLHALSLADGVERPFSPVAVAASVPGIGVGSSNGIVRFDPQNQIQRCALTLTGGRLFAAYGSYADTDPYHGWIIGFDASNLQQLPGYVFNSTPNSSVAAYGTHAGEGGIWMGGGGLAVDTASNLFFSTGNGIFDALNNSGGTEYADSFIRLSTSGGLVLADYFTPFNQAFLANNNLDLDAGGVALLPDQPGPFPHLMVGGGKQGKIYLMNRDLMTSGNNHYNIGGSTDFVVQTISVGGGIHSTPAYFGGKLFYAAAGDVLAAFTLVNGMFSSTYQSGTRHFAFPGATPSISADGTNNGILWAVQRANPALLIAYNPANLTNELYNSAQAAGGRDQLTNGVKFAVPTIANGKVYVGGTYVLAVFGLLQTPYGIWKSMHFGTNAHNPSIAGDLADPDGDGIINVLEYAFASDPLQTTASRPVLGAILRNHFQLQFSRNLCATDLTYKVQTAQGLGGPWTDLMTFSARAGWETNSIGATISESGAGGAAPDQYVLVTLLENREASGSSAFFRVAVIKNP